MGNISVLQNNPGAVINYITINLSGLFCKGTVFEKMLQYDEQVGVKSFALTYNRANLTQKRMRDYIKDIVFLMRRVKSQYPDIPIFLQAHSMGSLLVRTAYKHVRGSIEGMILISPAVPRGFWPARISALKKLVKYSSQIVLQGQVNPQKKDGRYVMAHKLPAEDFQHFWDSVVPESAYVLWENIIPWMRQKDIPNQVPTLVVIAEADGIIPPKSQQSFAYEIGADTCEIEGSHCAPLYDRDVMQKINRWCFSKI